MLLENNNKRNCKNCNNTWRLNRTLLGDQWVIDEIGEKTKKKKIPESNT
jgi:hypothetical protein